MTAPKATAARDMTAELAPLTRALKAPTRASRSAGRFAEPARAPGGVSSQPSLTLTHLCVFTGVGAAGDSMTVWRCAGDAFAPMSEG
jgi:hypothetical protein